MRRFLADMRGRVAALRNDAAEDAALREEMAFHLEMEAAQQGSVRGARVAFGGEDRWLEASRDARGARVLQDFVQDVRHAFRDMRRRAGFHFVTIFTLAIGLAAVTAVFSMTNRILLRPVSGVRAPEELRLVRFQSNQWNSSGVSWSNFVDLQSATPAFVGLAAHTTPRRMQMRAPGARGENVEGETVGGDFFGVLGMAPAAGRFFTADELHPRAQGNVVVISHRLWRSRYDGGDISGRTLELNGHTFDVIGVAPAGFHGAERRDNADAWLPPSAYPLTAHYPVDVAGDRNAGIFFELIGRKDMRVHDHIAEQQLATAMARLIAAYPDENEQFRRSPPRVHDGFGTAPPFRDQLDELMQRLFLIAAVVLLIACANVANLLLFRGLRMRGESAVRRALGASTMRLQRLHIAQALVLAFCATLTAVAIVASLLKFAGSVDLPLVGAVSDVGVDLRVLGFASLISLAMALAFATVPTMLARGVDLMMTLRARGFADSPRAGMIRRALVVLQFALSAALIVPAVLLMQSVQNLRSVGLGFDAEGVVAIEILPGPQGYDDEETRALRHRLLDEAARQPGFESAALSGTPPFTFVGNMVTLRGARQQEGGEGIDAYAEWVSRDFFSTLRVPLTGSTADPHALPVEAGVILNERAARELFGSTDVVGRSFSEEGFKGERTHVVGAVIPDIRSNSLRQEVEPAIYLPMDDTRDDAFYLLVRSSLPDAQAAAIADRILAGIDPALPFYRSSAISDRVRDAMQGELLFARLSATLGMIAALLSAIGLYALLAHSVAQRTREIGIRIALGARIDSILRLVAGDTAPLVFIGLALGCAAGWAIARLLQHLLYGVTLLEPSAYIAAAGFFAVVAAAAAALPARTAARVQPAVSLKIE